MRDWKFVWSVQVGSVSERAELSPNGARQARLAGLARRVGWDDERDTREKREVRDEREKLRQVDLGIQVSQVQPFSPVAPVSHEDYVCNSI